jgi:hypothetical protein
LLPAERHHTTISYHLSNERTRCWCRRRGCRCPPAARPWSHDGHTQHEELIGKSNPLTPFVCYGCYTDYHLTYDFRSEYNYLKDELSVQPN